MRITQGKHVSPLLVLMGLLIGLSSCGSAPSAPESPPGSKPDHMQIEIDRHLPSQEQPVVTLTVARDFDTGQSQYLQADQQFWTLLHQAANQ
jgi:hypothetical protein